MSCPTNPIRYALKTVFTITCFLLSTTLFSQKVFLNDSTASCLAKWNKGDRKILYIAHNKVNYENGKVSSESSFGYEAHVNVLEKYADGYKVQWTFQLPQELKRANPGLADSLPVFNGMKMVFKTDESGGFMELVNWQKVRDAYVRMMELSIPKNPDGSVDAAVEKTIALFSSRKMVETALIREIQLYYGPFGSSYSTRGTRVGTQLPNPLGDEPLPAVQSTQITALQPKEDHFTLVVTQDIDRAGATKLFEDIFKKMRFEDDKIVAEAKKLLQDFTISEHSEYHIRPSNGWITKIQYSKTGKTALMGQTDSYSIEMKPQ
jgi:hypothetical protein